MRIRLDKIGSEPFEWREEVSIAPKKLESAEVIGLSPIDWRGRIWTEHPGFQLEATLGYEQTVTCDRCLAPTVERVDTQVHWIVLQNAPQLTAEEVELSAEDLEITYVDGDELDADELLLEQLRLNVPMRSVCSDDCRGLCPRCGINRNLETCDCDQVAVDPRWEVLRDLEKPQS